MFILITCIFLFSWFTILRVKICIKYNTFFIHRMYTSSSVQPHSLPLLLALFQMYSFSNLIFGGKKWNHLAEIADFSFESFCISLPQCPPFHLLILLSVGLPAQEFLGCQVGSCRVVIFPLCPAIADRHSCGKRNNLFPLSLSITVDILCLLSIRILMLVSQQLLVLSPSSFLLCSSAKALLI